MSKDNNSPGGTVRKRKEKSMWAFLILAGPVLALSPTSVSELNLAPLTHIVSADGPDLQRADPKEEMAAMWQTEWQTGKLQ